MRKLILAIIAAVFSITLSYAESCSSGQGTLSYQISGCGDQSRACCSGQWCSWGTTSCASCTATSTTNSRNCSGNVSGACAGTQTQSCTRSVTGSCGSSCSYSGWSCGSWTGSCTYTQSCTATSESRNCSGNISGATSGTQTRTRSVTGSCGSCSYGSYGGWSGTCTCGNNLTWNASSQTCQCGTRYQFEMVNNTAAFSIPIQQSEADSWVALFSAYNNCSNYTSGWCNSPEHVGKNCLLTNYVGFGGGYNFRYRYTIMSCNCAHPSSSSGYLYEFPIRSLESSLSACNTKLTSVQNSLKASGQWGMLTESGSVDGTTVIGRCPHAPTYYKADCSSSEGQIVFRMIAYYCIK